MYKHCNSKDRGGQIYATTVSLSCSPTGLKKKTISLGFGHHNILETIRQIS